MAEPQHNLDHKGAADAYGVVLLDGSLHLNGVVQNYMDARRVAESLAMPSNIVRYTVPLDTSGRLCERCVRLVVAAHEWRKWKSSDQAPPQVHHMGPEAYVWVLRHSQKVLLTDDPSRPIWATEFIGSFLLAENGWGPAEDVAKNTARLRGYEIEYDARLTCGKPGVEGPE